MILRKQKKRTSLLVLLMLSMGISGIFAQSTARRIRRTDLPKIPPAIQKIETVRLIPIKSKQAEYEYVRYACPGCKVKKHIMSVHNGVPCDILVLIDEDGEERRFYFDISAFVKK